MCVCACEYIYIYIYGSGTYGTDACLDECGGYGGDIGDGYTYTLEEVGRIFKVTRERVRQVESKAIRKLQHPIRRQRLSNFLNGEDE